MYGKPGITKLNLAAIPLTLLMCLGSDADVIQSVAYLLEDEDYYNLETKEVSKVNANAASYASFMSIPMLFMSGFIYEIAGRRKTIIFFFLMGAVSTILFPIVSPSIVGFDVLRTTF